MTRYILSKSIFARFARTLALAGSPASFHEQTRYRSSDLVCGGLVVLLLKFLGKEKKRKKERRAPRSEEALAEFVRVAGRKRLLCPTRRVIVFPTRMADASSLLRLLPVVARMVLEYRENAFRVRASCVDAKTLAFARDASRTTTRLALLAKIDLLIRIDTKRMTGVIDR